LVLASMAFAAVWHAVDFPEAPDDEFPAVARPTFSRFPPPAYRLAEPGDTIDRVGIYVSSLAIVVAAGGLVGSPGRRGPWASALGLAVAAFWFEANPGPTFDGWHGLGWRTLLDPHAPNPLKLSLAAFALGLEAVVVAGLVAPRLGPRALWREARANRLAWLLALAAALAAARGLDDPGLGPPGYWPRWATVLSLTAFCAALVRAFPRRRGRRPLARLGLTAASAACWFLLVTAGIWLTWYHRPLERLRAVVPGRIYISAMPTAEGLKIAHRRNHFKTLVNLFPEDTPLRSPRLPEEVRFAAEHGINYVGSPPDVASADAFLDLTLRLARDPAAWPILVHCHGCMDRTPAWVGIYQFVVEGRPLDQALRFIEQHRGYRPKASVTLLYNRVLPRLAPARSFTDPTAVLLRRCAEGTEDPYYRDLRASLEMARPPGEPPGSPAGLGGEASAVLPSLTPRR
jgi:hypothetical protein